MIVTKFDSFDCAQTVFKTPKKTGSLYKSEAVWVRDNAPQPIFLQLPPMLVSEVNMDSDQSLAVADGAVKSGNKAYIELKVANDDFMYLLKEIDHHTSQFIFKNRTQWFPASSDDINLQYVEQAYKAPIIRRPRELDQVGKVIDTFIRLRLNVHEGEVYTRVFEDRAKRNIEFLRAGQTATAIVQFTGLTMYKESIAPEFVVHSIRVEPPVVGDTCLL